VVDDSYNPNCEIRTVVRSQPEETTDPI
jgi:hypothetical protein